MRRLLRASIAASILTLWIDGLLWSAGDAGPVGWALSMAVPQLFLLPCLAVALLAVVKKAWPAAGLSAAIATLQILGPLGLCLGRPSTEKANLRILSYNVGQFESHRWPEVAVANVADTIRLLDPDVACLQEAHYHGRYSFGALLAKRLPAWRAYVEGGMMILSKRPILSAETQLFPSHYGGHWNIQEVTIGVEGQDVRVLNTHLVPDGYEPPWWPKRPWLGMIERKRELRQEQFDEILRRVKRRPGPLALCGDFNTQPFGPAYRRMAATLTDAYRTTNVGFGYTLTASAPTKRVDYVWTNGMAPLRTRVAPFGTSDHLPLVAEVRISSVR